ncbi:TetR/AcrR family transcriptional regulator [Microbacterium gorillae]|uniref:TetR/AcrR family transcriptional regulator n=1 Tax=Microbacterium gorillae TaxID=1231063 RepID=UPI0006940C18|nr:TetR/AcrR family transcriptional regulator [Microbacterium gorillae]
MDPRVARSRARLQQALVSLARERALDTITVRDIADRAQLNRSTFYEHYADKETLLADALEQAADRVGRPLLSTVRDAPARTMPLELLAYLSHIRDNADLYRRVLGAHGSALVASRLRSHIGAITAQVVEVVSPEEFVELPTDVVGEALGGTALGVIAAWLRRDPLPPVSVPAEWLRLVISATSVPGVLSPSAD